MSRAPKPKPNGEAPDHRIQVPTEHVEFLKGKIAAKRTGVGTLAALYRVLAAREFERLGITDELALKLEEEEAAKAGASKRTPRKGTRA
jgi:hypothetical protein